MVVELFGFFAMYYIYMGVSGPSVLTNAFILESVDSMINAFAHQAISEDYEHLGGL